MLWTAKYCTRILSLNVFSTFGREVWLSLPFHRWESGEAEVLMQVGRKWNCQSLLGLLCAVGKGRVARLSKVAQWRMKLEDLFTMFCDSPQGHASHLRLWSQGLATRPGLPPEGHFTIQWNTGKCLEFWLCQIFTQRGWRGAWSPTIVLRVLTSSFFICKMEKGMLTSSQGPSGEAVLYCSLSIRVLESGHLRFTQDHTSLALWHWEVTGSFSATSAAPLLSPALENQWYCCNNSHRINTTAMRGKGIFLHVFLTWGILYRAPVTTFQGTPLVPVILNDNC